MNKSIIWFLFIVFILTPCISAAVSLPDFTQYKTKEMSQIKPASVNLTSHPRAKIFRTMLRAGAEKGPNFAGHYTIVTWGCGTACQEFAIVDALNGSVYFCPELKLNAYHMVTDESEPFTFRLDSKLLIVTGSPNDTEEIGIFYFVWEKKRLRLVHAVHKEWKY